jgi:hypothetical protein
MISPYDIKEKSKGSKYEPIDRNNKSKKKNQKEVNDTYHP